MLRAAASSGTSVRMGIWAAAAAATALATTSCDSPSITPLKLCGRCFNCAGDAESKEGDAAGNMGEEACRATLIFELLLISGEV
mmetsp:Transcript_20035/g.43619  ORF Transcript_20035/g.43619 Transcript_20035/m.43619 type:complete len:84 (-) Transcript_20035:354-605(-)